MYEPSTVCKNKWIVIFILHLPQIGLAISCQLSSYEKICQKSQKLFSKKEKKNQQQQKTKQNSIIDLWSAEFVSERLSLRDQHWMYSMPTCMILVTVKFIIAWQKSKRQVYLHSPPPPSTPPPPHTRTLIFQLTVPRFLRCSSSLSVRLWLHMWRLFYPNLFLISPYLVGCVSWL